MVVEILWFCYLTVDSLNDTFLPGFMKKILMN